MDILPIKQFPDPILREKCLSVKDVTAEEKKLFEQMLFIMRHFKGIGLAAPQVGISKSLIVADLGDNPICLANPKLLKVQGLSKMEEGCLSIPNTSVLVERPDEIIVGGLNEKGKSIIIEARRVLAKVLQHEMDHLEGKLIIDYLNPLEWQHPGFTSIKPVWIGMNNKMPHSPKGTQSSKERCFSKIQGNI